MKSTPPRSLQKNAKLPAQHAHPNTPKSRTNSVLKLQERRVLGQHYRAKYGVK